MLRGTTERRRRRKLDEVVCPPVLDEREAAAVHRNLMAFNARMADSPAGRVVVGDGSLLFAGGSAMPFVNGVMRCGDRGDAEALLDQASNFFERLGRGFLAFCWPGDPPLEAAARRLGMFEVLARYPTMVRRSPLPQPQSQIHVMQSEHDAATYWQICDSAYRSLGLPATAISDSFTPPMLLDSQAVVACIALHRGEPAGCAAAFLAEKSATVAWVATLDHARGHGLAAACTAYVTNVAFARGARRVSLQASFMGESLYRRIGYEEIFAYKLLGAMPTKAV